MLWKRNVRGSLYKMIKEVLADPPGEYIDLGFPVYNVYAEDKYVDQSFTPTVPFIFVVDAGITLALQRLPYVAVDFTSHVGNRWEMGNSKRLKTHEFSLHIHGRTRAERDDIGSFLSEMLEMIHIYDLSTDPPVLLETVPFADGVALGDIRPADETAEEATNLNYSLVTGEFATSKV